MRKQPEAQKVNDDKTGSTGTSSTSTAQAKDHNDHSDQSDQKATIRTEGESMCRTMRRSAWR